MKNLTHLLITASLLLVPVTSLLAQTAPDPSGHWAGAIHVPPFNGAGAREVGIEIDFSKNAGVPAATFSQPDQHVKGLPLSNVVFDGAMVSFELKANGGGLFRGTLTDAASIAGEFVTSEGGYTIPFNLARTGDAQRAAAPQSAAIGKEIEGTWHGAIEVGGKQERLVLKMANQPDGSATGTIQDLDGSNVEIPIAITQKASGLTVEVAAVGASYIATLNPGAELVGTWNQGEVKLPVTFKRMTR